MALTPCPECRAEISDAAQFCPRCGHVFHPEAAPFDGALDDRLLEMLACEGKIAAIKLYRDQVPTASLAKAKEYVENLQAARPHEYGAPKERNSHGNTVGCLYLMILVIVLYVLWVLEPRLAHSWQRANLDTPPPVTAPSDSSPR